MEDLIIFPCNGNAIEALDCLGEKFRCIAFIDDNPEKIGTTVCSVPVLDRSILVKNSSARVLAVPGSPSSFRVRKEIIDGLVIDVKRFAQVIHPNANVSKWAKIGTNVLIYPGVCITASAQIGDHVCILPNTVVHHDSTIGDYSLVGASCAIAGYVRIGLSCYIGSKSSLKNNTEIGDNVLVGMGSNVVSNINAGQIVYGNPARNISLK